jgi:subtilisin family serine protease
MADPDSQREPLDPETTRGRARVQLDIIEAAVGRETFGWYSEGERGNEGSREDFRYLFRRGHVVVRDQDVELVQSVLRGAEPVQNEDTTDGVTLLALPPDDSDVPSALRRLDRELVPGLATPDHILYVTPASCCPATEPEVVAKGTDPRPTLSDDAQGGSGVKVSVVDTGWWVPAETDPRLDWLEGVTGDPEHIDPDNIHPYGGHGTFIAGIVRCVAPSTGIHVEGFLPNGGAVFESAIFKQVKEALLKEPDIISLSAGTTTRHNLHLLAFEVLWETQVKPLGRTILVAAAGNDGTSRQFYPAALPWAYSVGSIDPDGQRSDFSNYGSWVDGYAVGRDTVNAFPDGKYTCHEPPNVGDVRVFETGLAQWSGTSFSTPTVSGIIAARMSATAETSTEAADIVFNRAKAARASTGGLSVLTPGPHNNI